MHRAGRPLAPGLGGRLRNGNIYCRLDHCIPLAYKVNVVCKFGDQPERSWNQPERVNVRFLELSQTKKKTE
jgi:hypothetical protein